MTPRSAIRAGRGVPATSMCPRSRVVCRLRDHPYVIGQIRSIDELAKAARMSRSAFAEKFKVAVGESPGRYMLSLPMLSAKQLLENSSRTVSSVAVELGYGSQAAFSTAFKRVVGASPRDSR
jgi:AraC-like DNA-binding protein